MKMIKYGVRGKAAHGREADGCQYYKVFEHLRTIMRAKT
jgi:hypothetical protein